MLTLSHTLGALDPIDPTLVSQGGLSPDEVMDQLYNFYLSADREFKRLGQQRRPNKLLWIALGLGGVGTILGAIALTATLVRGR